MAKKKRSRRGKNAGELPQAAPLASDSDDELELLPRVDLYKRTSGWS